MAITRHYRAQHTLATAPVILVYSLMMTATAVTFALDSATSTEEQPSEYHQHISFLLKALKECSVTYGAAVHTSKNLKRAMARRHGKNAEPESDNASPSSDADGPRGAPQPATEETVTKTEVTSDFPVEGSSPTWWNNEFTDFGELGVSGQEWENMAFFNDPESEMLSNLNWNDAFM